MLFDLANQLVNVFKVVFISHGVIIVPSRILQMNYFQRRVIGFQVPQLKLPLGDAWSQELSRDELQLEGVVPKYLRLFHRVAPILDCFLL